MEQEPRKIIHIDMDAFFASVEILDNPSLKDKAVIVGGSPEKRGVVAAANYIARKFGIHSAMSSAKAYQLCPDAIFLKSSFSRYRECSQQVFAILKRYTDLIESSSLDEAWLDVSQNHFNESSATYLAKHIKKTILQEVGLVASAGVSYNKYLSKIASDYKKPDGIFVISPQNSLTFLKNLPIRKIPGVGKQTQKKLAQYKIITCGDALKYEQYELIHWFGKFGSKIYWRVRGIDYSSVSNSRIRKSVSTEKTFHEDYKPAKIPQEILENIILEFLRRAEKSETTGKTLVVKIKFSDFEQITRSKTFPENVLLEKAFLLEYLKKLISDVESHQSKPKKVRLIGVGLSNFCDKNENPLSTQLSYLELS